MPEKTDTTRSGRLPTGALVLGWQEWVALPELGLSALRAKIDTGARTSALHAIALEPYGPESRPRLRFRVQPVPRRPDIEIACDAALVDHRDITSSNGERERRYVIATTLAIAGFAGPIEITLTDRAAMRSRMLIGRQAIPAGALIDPRSQFRQPRLGWRGYPGWKRRKPRPT